MRFLLLLFPILLFSQDVVTLEFLRDKPRSVTKDYYIDRFLKQPNLTKDEVSEVFYQIDRMSWKFLRIYAQYSDDMDLKECLECMDLGARDLMIRDNNCFLAGITLSKAKNLNEKELDKLIERLDRVNKSKVKIYSILKNRDILEALQKEKDSKLVVDFILAIGTDFFKKNFNQTFSKEFLDRLASESRFDRVIRNSILTDMQDFQKSLIKIESKNLNYESNFYLSMNAIRFKDYKHALRFLDVALSKAKLRSEKDKVRFWQYQLSKDTNILKELSKSADINIYSLYAMEKFGIEPKGYITEVVTNNSNKDMNISEPFLWAKFQELGKSIDEVSIKKEFEEWNYKNTEPYLTYLLERVAKGNKDYFIKPYFELLKDYSLERTALILAISRQESRFVPTAMSHSYAIGMMQFMPFLIKDIAQRRKDGVVVEDLFRPEIAYDYANFHLDYLEKHLKHPLFIAYGYNGGIGFTKRMLKSGMFEKGAFEPFFSMEMVDYAESREYGKKVLANYIIYQKLLGKKDVKLSTVFENAVMLRETLYAQN